MGEFVGFMGKSAFTLRISQSLEQGITSVRRISQRYRGDETSPAVLVPAALSHISVPE